MQRCEHCKVNMKGEFQVCPLCGGIPKGGKEKGEDVFPHIPTIYQEFNIFIRLLLFISITIVVISIAINVIAAKESRWSLFVAAGIGCMWVSLFFIIQKKHNIPKTIVWQAALFSILSILWDLSMGWYGWSITYVLPAIYVSTMIVMAIAAKILKISVRDYIIYLLIDGLFGFIPILFIVFGWVSARYPSVICVATSAINLSALILFQGDNIKGELDKRMHI